MLAGGAEAAIIPSGIGGFIACRALSSRNQDPTKASRPWDKNRDGFVMGEGAGVRLVLSCVSMCGVELSCVSICGVEGSSGPHKDFQALAEAGGVCAMRQGADVRL